MVVQHFLQGIVDAVGIQRLCVALTIVSASRGFDDLLADFEVGVRSTVHPGIGVDFNTRQGRLDALKLNVSEKLLLLEIHPGGAFLLILHVGVKLLYKEPDPPETPSSRLRARRGPQTGPITIPATFFKKHF